ncbi:MAG: hypothetical protein D6696_21170 [Acidobacteria bacterium]|nr:MAG: hypothetical protein D6696_21170 [Acidobacteriota bacterium]
MHSVQTTGDGYTLVAKDAWAGFRLAMALQGACDRFAHDVRSACLSDELEFHQQRLESGFDFETRIGVATDRLVSRGSEHTGPVFFRAARITDKARPDRGVFSPLFDERTKDLVQDQAKDWRFFLVGDFDVDSKSGFERPLPVLHAGSSIHQTRLYSAVATGGPLAPLAERFDEAIRAYYKQRSIRAMKHFGELRRELENDATSIEAGLGHGGEIVLRRWRAAIRHFSYLPLAGGR